MTQSFRRIVLIGPSGTGKSTVARIVAGRLGWAVHDTDGAIIREAGRDIATIFSEEGEPAFRERERRAVAHASSLENTVIATGGGAPVDPSNAELLWRDAFVVALQARPETALQRLAAAAEARPLLQDDPLLRLRALQEERAAVYGRADWTIRTDGLTPGEVAAEIERAARVRAPDLVALRQPAKPDPQVAFTVHTTTARYPIVVGWEIIATLGARMRAAGLGDTAHVIADANAWEHYGEPVLSALRSVGIEAGVYPVSGGETSKTLDEAADIYDWLVGRRAERGDSIVAVGGGVTGDLAGFVAATFLRGIPLVQAPTTLLAMVDASIGGKVAVDHREGKNLIGAFYQPRLVFTDVAALATLPPRELTAGWAEVVKHALIMDPGLLTLLEERSAAVAALDPDFATRVVARNVALKGQVVAEDERETDLRAILNYGHTIGHAIEAVTGYGRYLHGEAIAVGMAAAAAISRCVTGLSADAEARQNALLQRFHLPLTAPGLDPAHVLAATAVDKKVRGKRIRWVLLEDIGRPVIRDDVPLDVVREAIATVLPAAE